jgi:hypothetical protein
MSSWYPVSEWPIRYFDIIQDQKGLEAEQDQKRREAEHHEQQQRRWDAMSNWYPVSKWFIKFFDIYDIIVVHAKEYDNTL